MLLLSCMQSLYERERERFQSRLAVGNVDTPHECACMCSCRGNVEGGGHIQANNAYKKIWPQIVASYFL
jgi:hypothetical protein